MNSLATSYNNSTYNPGYNSGYNAGFYRPNRSTHGFHILNNAPNYFSSSSINIGNVLRNAANLPLPNANLGKSILVQGAESSIAITGSFDPTGIHNSGTNTNHQNNANTNTNTNAGTLKDNFLVAVDFVSDTCCVPSVTCVDSNLTQLTSVGTNSFLASFGDSSTAIYQYSQELNTIQACPFTIPGKSTWHNDLTSELTVSPIDSTKVISTSYDGEVAIIDLSIGMERRTNTIQSVTLPDRFVMKAQFCPLQSLDALFVTNSLDDSIYTASPRAKVCIEMHDLRSPINPSQPKLMYSAYDAPISAVSYLNDANTIITGYVNGKMQIFDLRHLSQPICEIQDPYVQSIESIEYNEETQSFVVSGLSDFTVWKTFNIEKDPKRMKRRSGKSLAKRANNDSSSSSNSSSSDSSSCNSNSSSDSDNLHEDMPYRSNSIKSSIHGNWSHSHQSTNTALYDHVTYNAKYIAHGYLLVTDSLCKATVYDLGFDRLNQS